MKHKSVSRIDQDEKHTHGWYVRVRFRGKEVSRFFNDKLNGGKRKALREAITFRDELERRIGKPRTDRFVVQRESTRKGDVVGVRQVVKFTSTAEGETRSHQVYEVTWSPEPNVVQRTSVSIRKYGKREALRRAIAIRKDKERLYYGS
ncbi:MAG TPA: AP2 domain-containing protein [Thermoanaerobaculia bacterium]|nr:AP2 domain-containing protein [Thermoanaerobaculia bacterium]